MAEDIDYKAVTEQLQIENEVLRNQMHGMLAWNRDHVWAGIPKPDLSWFRSLSTDHRMRLLTIASNVLVIIVLIVVTIRGDV